MNVLSTNSLARVGISSVNQLSRMILPAFLAFLRIIVTSVSGLVGLCVTAIGMKTLLVIFLIKASVSGRSLTNLANWVYTIVTATIS